MAKPHKHAAIIKAWADDPSQAVWCWNPHHAAPEWLRVQNIYWEQSVHYALGDKPTAPPRKMCTLAGVAFPAPETEAPPHCMDVYFSSPMGTSKEWWISAEYDLKRLHAGFMHLDRASAELHSTALAAANRQAIEAAR